jgi:ABC-2 type transport system ATP-binding protein
MIGYVADEPYFYEKMSGYEHLCFIADLYGIDQKARDERIDSLSQTLLLKPNLGDEIASYSHGMKQKLAIIAALLPNPELLVLDEPMVGLDPNAAYLLKTLLGDYAKAGNTVFFSTHVLEVAQSLCDTLGIIKEGKLLACGSFSELRGNGKEKDATLEQLFLELTEEGSAQ